MADRGSDEPEVFGSDGTPTGNLFYRNTILGNAETMKIIDTTETGFQVSELRCPCTSLQATKMGGEDKFLFLRQVNTLLHGSCLRMFGAIAPVSTIWNVIQSPPCCSDIL